jgi:uncharacterized protein (DUF2249 family)
MDTKLFITPRTKVAELLDHYPELEDDLVGMAPAFETLRNPVLRKTVASVTSLQNVAKIANIQVTEMVNTLREKVGQEKMEGIEEEGPDQKSTPSWFVKEKIVKHLDARPMIESGGHPLGEVMKEVNDLKKGEIYELTTPFLPAPLIERVMSMGFDKWTRKESAELFYTYFYKQS